MAELMKHGKVETRTWSTDWRGLVLICSSVVPFSDRELMEICGPKQFARISQVLGKKWFNSVKRGNAIAVGRLINCKSMFAHQETNQTKAEALTFVKYNPSLWLHIYEDVTAIEPFPWRGQLGWKTLTPEEKAKIKIL